MKSLPKISLLILCAISLCFLTGCDATTPEEASSSISDNFPNPTNVVVIKDQTTGDPVGYIFTTVLDDKPRRIYMDGTSSESITVCLEGCSAEFSGKVEDSSNTRQEALNKLTLEEKTALGL